jgi:hypothetical protein
MLKDTPFFLVVRDITTVLLDMRRENISKKLRFKAWRRRWWKKPEPIDEFIARLERKKAEG